MTRKTVCAIIKVVQEAEPKERKELCLKLTNIKIGGENMKKILAACIKQIIQFDSEAEFEAFLKKLIGTYHIVSKNVSRDGTVIVEINRNYNNNKLIEN